MNQTPKYKVGSVIEYRAFGGDIRRVLVEEKDADIKNGQAGFCGTQQGGACHTGCWGYDDQITRVVRY